MIESIPRSSVGQLDRCIRSSYWINIQRQIFLTQWTTTCHKHIDFVCRLATIARYLNMFVNWQVKIRPSHSASTWQIMGLRYGTILKQLQDPISLYRMTLLGWATNPQQSKVKILTLLSSKGQYLGHIYLKILPKNENVRKMSYQLPNSHVRLIFGDIQNIMQITQSMWVCTIYVSQTQAIFHKTMQPVSTAYWKWGFAEGRILWELSWGAVF